MAYAYKVAGQTVEMEPDTSVVAVRFQPGPMSFRAAATTAAGVGPFSRRFEIPGEELTIIPASAPAVADPTAMSGARALSSLNARPEVAHALPVFRVGGNQVVATERVIVGLSSREAGEAVAQKHGLEILKAEDERILARIPQGADPFALALALNDEPGVRYAEPDFVTIGRRLPKRVPSPTAPVLRDPLIPRQYAMKITRADEAWTLGVADPKIRIAILDDGIQTTHPDLAAAVVGAFDATQNGGLQGPNPWDSHGTCCAGLAAAVGGNGVGIRGVAAGCSLLAVRIAYADFAHGPWVSTTDGIRSGIQWSWQNGADVLSNSWSTGAPSNDIIDAFEQARTQGRGGRGCVVVVAAGNDFDEVSFPANLRDVLTVSASNEYDEAKTKTSRDGEDWWGTNFGPAVDVAAPGVHNMTTDIVGMGGSSPDDYAPGFNGTSSATPIVAGACAMVLSANPGLSEAQVRQIIMATADKVGPYPYAEGRNDLFGSGRLNVYGATLRAQSTAAA